MLFRSKGDIDDSAIRRAMGYGSVVASFGVEEFSLDRLCRLSRRDIENRYQDFLKLTHLG